MKILLPCISLIEPYASLILSGRKTIETRTGPVLSGFQGLLLISISKKAPLPFDPAPYGISKMPSPPEGWPSDIRGMAAGVVEIKETTPPYGYSRSIMTPYTAQNLHQAACFDPNDRYLSFIKKAGWLTSPVSIRAYPGRFPVEIEHELLPGWVHDLLAQQRVDAVMRSVPNRDRV